MKGSIFSLSIGVPWFTSVPNMPPRTSKMMRCWVLWKEEDTSFNCCSILGQQRERFQWWSTFLSLSLSYVLCRRKYLRRTPQDAQQMRLFRRGLVHTAVTSPGVFFLSTPTASLSFVCHVLQSHLAYFYFPSARIPPLLPPPRCCWRRLYHSIMVCRFGLPRLIFFPLPWSRKFIYAAVPPRTRASCDSSPYCLPQQFSSVSASLLFTLLSITFDCLNFLHVYPRWGEKKAPRQLMKFEIERCVSDNCWRDVPYFWNYVRWHGSLEYI